MNKGERVLNAGIVDFSTRRMTPQEADHRGIPLELRPFVADWRQYPLKISDQLPEGVLWFDERQPWYFREVFSDPEKVQRLRDSSFLILSASGMSAYKFQEGLPPIDTPHEKDREYLENTEQMIRDHLGEGKWVLGDCFGGQLSVYAIGGILGRLPNNQYGHTVTEAGYLEHQLTEAGRKDEVFGHLPDKYYAAHFHSDFVEKLPDVGTKVATASAELEVIRTEVLAIRHGYLDRDGLKNTDTAYIHAAVIEFNNGARLYHTQPHPEMSTPERATFFIRHVGWFLRQEEEMGEEYTRRAMEIPEHADFLAAQIITNFVEAYRQHIRQEFLQIATPAIIGQLRQFSID